MNSRSFQGTDHDRLRSFPPEAVIGSAFMPGSSWPAPEGQKKIAQDKTRRASASLVAILGKRSIRFLKPRRGGRCRLRTRDDFGYLLDMVVDSFYKRNYCSRNVTSGRRSHHLFNYTRDIFPSLVGHNGLPVWIEVPIQAGNPGHFRRSKLLGER
jgi:hypothetical protein